MSFPPRPPMGRGMPMNMGMPVMGSGVDPWGNAMRMGVQIPPPNMPPPHLRNPPPFYTGGPSGVMRTPGINNNNEDNTPVFRNPIIQAKPSLNFVPDHPIPTIASGPPVPVFVGNITERWPDAMIRQLLATCGQILNWKRVQGASGKLQGFGFCDFNGPDAGLRAVRLLHGVEVGDKKLVVKVDAKTNSVLDEFKAERKSRKPQNNGTSSELVKADPELDYMDLEMTETDERSRMRIEIIFREFKSDLDGYTPAGSEGKGKDKDGTGKHAIQEKLHLLKLSSLEPPSSDADVTEDLAVEEGKREIITQEISKFRENMKQEKQREDERKKIGRERREREKEREEIRQKKHEKDGDESSPRRRERERDLSKSKCSISPVHRRRSRSSSRPKNEPRKDRDRRGRSRDGNRDRDRGVHRDWERDRDRDRGNRRRSRDRERSTSKPMDRDRSPYSNASHKPRYREREEEEEATELKRIDRKARERETNYEERLRLWEHREAKKIREDRKELERHKRSEEELLREAKRMKQFFEDYDDEKHDAKYYKGKELQKRLADRATELESDNRDRQREREELEEMKLRMLTGSATGTPNTATSSPATLFEKYKKPMTDTTNTAEGVSSQFQILTSLKSSTSVQARLLSLAGQLPRDRNKLVTPTTSGVSQNESPGSQLLPATNVQQQRAKIPQTQVKDRSPYASSQAQPQASGVGSQHYLPIVQPSTSGPAQRIPDPHQHLTQQTSFNSVQFCAFVPLKSTSNPSTPSSLANSPAVALGPEMSGSVQSLAGTGFQLSLNNSSNNNNQPLAKDDDSHHSYSPGGSPGGNDLTPDNFARDDDSSMQGLSPDLPKSKKITVQDVFNQEEDENDGLGSGRKRKLVPLDYGEEARKLKRETKIQEDKKIHIKSLIDKIPTEKDALFTYDIDWEMVDDTLMEKRIRPWINKKIVEYIGEPEPTLVDFICTKVLARSAPQLILDDVMMVLDEEAEVFVVKMWRLLVYEIEAKKFGIATKS